MQINIIEGRTERRKLRVCAYCRVSTDADEQENSLENQIKHYKDAIQSNPEYEYVGVYSDFAISGFKEQRPGFQRMMDDARQGKGDFIMQKTYVNAERKQVRNHGEKNSWYIEDDHPAIVSRELWQKAQDAVKRKREYRATGSFIADMNDENYPYRNRLFCSECGFPLYPRIYSNGNRLNWGCSGRVRYGTTFCKGINVPDGTIRNWNFDEDIYIRQDSAEKGFKEFSFLKESSWKRRHKKKVYVLQVPQTTNEVDYPYHKHLHCAICGYRLTRVVNKKNHSITWVCSGNKHYGKDFCLGVRVPDAIIKSWGDISSAIFIERKVKRNGEKSYSYSGKKPDRGKAKGTEC